MSIGTFIIFALTFDQVVSQLSFKQEDTWPELSILCRLTDSASSVLSSLDGLIISRLDPGARTVIASLFSHSDQSRPLPRSSDGQVTGDLSHNASSSQFLRILWSHRKPSQDGYYTCEAYGVDINIIPQILTQHLTIQTEIGPLHFVSVPDVIKPGLTELLHIHCTLPDHAILNITKMASLEIFKQQNGIKCQFAKIKLESGETVLSGAFKASLNGSIGDDRSFLGLTWGNITTADAGEFICEGSGVNAKGHPVFFSSYINLTWQNPSREELVKLLFDIYDREHELLRIQEEKKQKAKEKLQLVNRLSNTQCRKPNSCDSTVFEYGLREVSVEPDDGLGPISVLCEGIKPGEIWTVFQKRFNGSVDFYRNFSDYENGFGSLYGEFWLGLKNIRRLLLQNENKNKLRIEITEMTSGKNYTKSYHSFSIGPPTGYKLFVIGFDDLGYGMSFNSGFNFSTPDHGVPRLAVLNRAGGWFNYDSPYVNLNGVWGVRGKRYSVYWSEFRRDRNVILGKTEMKFRRNF